MRKAIPPLLLLASVFVWVACDSSQPTQPVDLEGSFSISDQLHEGGTEGFFWLPPLVDNPNANGEFVGTLSPVVKIHTIDCVANTNPGLSPTCTSGSLLRTYTMETGVDVDLNGEHYQLNWQTDQTPEGETPIAGGTYRITVLLDDLPIGHADVEIVKNMGGFKNLNNPAGEVIGLIDGQTLPVKFKVERGVLPHISEIWDLSFQSTRDGNFDVYLMDRDGGSVVNLTNSPGTLDGTANWHPTEPKLIFTSDRADPGEHPHLYTMNPDGTDVQPLLGDQGLIEGWQAEYSPDGSRIVFQKGWPPQPEWPNSGCDPEDEESPCGREHDIWIMDADGSNPVQLTDVPFPIGPKPPDGPWDWIDLYEDWSPTWDPTGSWVTFGRSRNGSDYEQHVPGWLDCDGHTIPHNWTWEFFWNNKRAYCYFDVVSIDVSDFNPDTPWFQRSWIRHTYDLGADQLGPKWSPEGVLTLKEGVDDGSIVALYDGLPEDYSAWPSTPRRNLTAPNQSGDIAWSPNGSEVLFSSGKLGPVGIFHVSNWAGWLASGAPAPSIPLVVEPEQRNDWARWRPGH